MKKCSIVLAVVAALSMTACDRDNGGSTGGAGEGGSAAGDGVYYVLNAGDWKSSNSSLTRYDSVTGEEVQFFFEQQNGRGMGNTANDIIVYGSKMYIAVAGESTVEITDLGARSVKQIDCGAQPRYLAAAGGKVYVSYYDGYVARIDTVTLEVDAKVKVGRNPEQLAVAGDRLYVANSGGMDYNTAVGYDNTLSVIDLGSFEELEKLEVVLNPVSVVACGEYVFVASYGNYADVPSTLQCVDTRTGSVQVVKECSNMTEFCYDGGVLYGYFSQYDENWNAVTTYLSYDVATGDVVSPWINESVLPVPYKLSTAGGFLCVTESDYLNDGDVYMYDRQGMLVAKVPSGLNPVKVVKAE